MRLWLAGLSVMVAMAASGVGCERDPSPDATQPAATQAGAGYDKAAARKAIKALSGQFKQHVQKKRSIEPLLVEAREVIERFPQHAPAHTLLSQMLLMTGQQDAAYERIQKALALDPAQGELRLIAGTILTKRGQIERAEAQYRRAIEIDPRNGRYRLHLAQALMQQQRHDEARQQLLTALQHDSTLHGAHAALSDLYMRQDKLERAQTHIRRALDLLPPQEELNKKQKRRKLVYVQRRAALLRRVGNAEAALSVLMDLPAKDVFKPGVRDDLAECWAMLGEPAKAARHYELAVRRDPTDADAAAAAANWHLEARQYKQARRMVEQLQRINPRHAKLAELREQVRAALNDNATTQPS